MRAQVVQNDDFIFERDYLVQAHKENFQVVYRRAVTEVVNQALAHRGYGPDNCYTFSSLGSQLDFKGVILRYPDPIRLLPDVGGAFVDVNDFDFLFVAFQQLGDELQPLQVNFLILLVGVNSVLGLDVPHVAPLVIFRQRYPGNLLAEFFLY